MLTEADLVAGLPAMRRYAHRLTGNSDAAGDLVQATALRAWAKRHLYDDEGAGKSERWLFSMMHNLSHDMRRSAASHPAESWADPPAVAAPAQQLWRVLVSETIEAIDRLPYGMRMTMIAGALGEKYEDMAAQFGWYQGTVRSRLSRGRAALRRQMEG